MALIHIQEIWRWWLSQINGLFSDRDPRNHRRGRVHTEVLLSEPPTVYRNARLDAPVTSATRLTDEEHSSEAWTLLARGEKVIVSFDTAQCFRRTTVCTRSALPNVERLVNLELERVAPFGAGEAVSAWTIKPLDGQMKQYEVDHFVGLRSRLNGIVAEIEAVGSLPFGIAFRNQQGESLPFLYDMQGGVFGAQKFAKWRNIAGLTTLAACFVSVAYLFVLINNQTTQLAALDVAIAGEQKSAALVRSKLEVESALYAELLRVQERKVSEPSIPLLWEELTRRLPDTAWVQNLAYNRGELSVSGMAVTPEELISLLEASTHFKDVKFTSPVYKAPDDAQARFMISMKTENPQSASREQ